MKKLPNRTRQVPCFPQDRMRAGVTKWDFAFARDAQGKKQVDPDPELPYCTYAIINLHNGRRYYGFCRRWHARVVKHCGDLESSVHPNAELQADYDAEGEVFEFLIIAKHPKIKGAKKAEAALIKADPTCYNVVENRNWL